MLNDLLKDKDEKFKQKFAEYIKDSDKKWRKEKAILAGNKMSDEEYDNLLKITKRLKNA